MRGHDNVGDITTAYKFPVMHILSKGKFERNVA